MARITLAVVFPISVGLFMLSAPIIYLFSGKEYMPTSPVLKIFAIYMIVSAFLSILNHQVFFINGKERKSVYLFFLFGIVNTLAVWILGSSITPEYAILTTCVSQALLTVVMAIYARRNLGVFCELFNLQVVKYLVCSLIVVPIVLISCWIMDSYYLQLALSIPISIIAYSGILLMLKDDAILELIRKVPFIGHKGA
jgi:O-antigen/teichoic acid export membrane protein